jgi:2-polyprenyl-6-methoxyphenol hydroxylase-like FAD-dependent oxidoreductase
MPPPMRARIWASAWPRRAVTALARALRDHDDIDTALGAYNAERQPIGNNIVMHSRKLSTHMGVNLKTEEDRRIARAAAERRRDA